MFTFHEIYRTCHPWPWLSPFLTAMLCTLGLVDDVMFPYNGGNGPESKMTHMFHPVRQVAALGGEVCRLRLHLVCAVVNCDYYYYHYYY